MAKKEYLTFVEKPEGLAQGKETELLIKDLAPGRRKYDAHYVRAIICRNPQDLPDADVLWLRGWVGVLYPEPWAIRILREVGPFPSHDSV
ncbi:MAG: hypothetical protein Q8P24_11075 [Desulfobacterales bacterium]|nr:hypothetical protein [Desulfobacterales bacterium]